ncbi:MAG: glycine cleavage system aminomethyltransferase GcvT [Galactobacter sp.]
MTTISRHTSLHPIHEELGAAFTDFGGWDMPLRYGSDKAEHTAVRTAAGLFDLSHMGEVWVSGPDAATYLNTALAGNLARVAIGKAKYTMILNEDAGIIDDLIVYRIAETRYLVVPNAGNAPVVAQALKDRAAGFDVEVQDASADTGLVAVQGPNAEAIMLAAVSTEHDRANVTGLGYYAWTSVVVDGVDVLLARTGYTGEDGFELFVPSESAPTIWAALTAAGGDHGLVPCGLAARDSLRLEAGMPLYGHELGLDLTPLAAGLGPVVSLKKSEDFVGRTAFEAAKEAGQGTTTGRRLVGLRGVGRRAARAGYSVADPTSLGTVLGEVTSGLPSPTLGYPVALAYVEADHAAVGTELAVDLRGKAEAFTVVDLPFYSRTK